MKSRKVEMTHKSNILVSNAFRIIFEKGAALFREEIFYMYM